MGVFFPRGGTVLWSRGCSLFEERGGEIRLRRGARVEVEPEPPPSPPYATARGVEPFDVVVSNADLTTLAKI